MKFRIAVAVVVLVVVPFSLAPRAQGRDRWMGTWATAAVGRPQVPPMPVPGPPPFMANQCPAPVPVAPPPAGQTFTPLPFVQFTNQTLRQIVHVSIGGSKARVVVSNVYGTTPLTIGAGHVGLREARGTIKAGSGGPLTFSGRPTGDHPRQRHRLQRRGDDERAADERLGGRSVSARQHQRGRPADDAHGRLPDELCLGDRQSRRLAINARRGDDPELVSTLARRGCRTRRDGAHRGVWRFDHRRHPFDAGYEQPLARCLRPTPVRAVAPHQAGRHQRGHRG